MTAAEAEAGSGNYRGRFAPSPTGPLHFGSLIAAVGSFLEARRHGGEWLVRIDDIDPDREQPGAADSILRTLERFGLRSDGPVVFQSRRRAAYDDALEHLRDRGAIFPCGCTRKEVLRLGRPGVNGILYPGTCRDGLPPGRQARTWRARATGRIRFEDDFQGPVDCDLASDIGDFLVQRADDWPAYHLAAAVDDAASGITHVVRGHDLLPCTPPQLLLLDHLDAPAPRYGHLPVAVNLEGRKLSKQNRAQPLDDSTPAPLLHAALVFLCQHPPPALARGTVDDLWAWAREHWDPAPLRGRREAPSPIHDEQRSRQE